MKPQSSMPDSTDRPVQSVNRIGHAGVVVHGIVAAFSVYFCMYAFRKPFSAVTFSELQFLGTRIDLKTACVISQSVGYLLSKYIGAKICTEVSSARRVRLLLGLILLAEFGLLLFAVLPESGKPVAMLINGLPLGMVWGVVIRYLEGRRSSELLMAGLSCSYIIAGAVTRDIGRDVVIGDWGIAPIWMPFTTGALFFIPFCAAIWLLDRLPAPTASDESMRSPRHSMKAEERREFIQRFRGEMILLLIAYFFLTAFRDFRDQYAAELFQSLGLDGRRAIFFQTERWAVLGTIVAAGGLCLIPSHRAALAATYAVIITGFLIIGASTIAFEGHAISGYTWMATVSLGMYLAYVPFGVGLFERIMAGSRLAGTSVFAIQLADGVGYTGSVLIQFYRDLAHGDADRLAFVLPFAEVTSVIGIVVMLASGLLLKRHISDAPT